MVSGRQGRAKPYGSGPDNATPSRVGSFCGAIYMPYPQSVQGDWQLPAAMNLLGANNGGHCLGIHRQSPLDDGLVHQLCGSGDHSCGSRDLWSGLAGSQRTYEVGMRLAIGATKSNRGGQIVMNEP